jgi:hypothetical protein
MYILTFCKRKKPFDSSWGCFRACWVVIMGKWASQMLQTLSLWNELLLNLPTL